MARSHARLALYGFAILAAIGALIVLMAGWNSVARWLPWTAQWDARVATARADRAEREARVSNAVNEGQADIAASVEHHTIIIREADRIAADAEIEARTAPDAETPLDPDRADRLRRADERLCELVPDSCAPASADHP